MPRSFHFVAVLGSLLLLFTGQIASAQLIVPCEADFDRDGSLSYRDFDAFVASFEAGGAACDLNGDHQLTFEDFDAFIQAFDTGCISRPIAPLFPGVVFDTPYDPNSVAFSDLDGDGKPDMIVSREVGDVVIYRNLTAPGEQIAFLSPFSVVVEGTAASVAAGDLDGDGRPDLVVAKSDSNRISVVRNASLGGGVIKFDRPIEYVAGTGPVGIALADLDGDGDLDIAVVCYFGDVVHVFRNDGRGLFTEAARVTTGERPRSIALADMNADGKPDIVLVNDLGSSMSVLMNATQGMTTPVMFGPRSDYATPARPQSVAIADLDGDGHLDIATASTTTNIVSVRRNAGDGTFPERTDVPTIAGGSWVVSGDFDQDGKPDLAVTNYFPGTVSVLPNRSEGLGSIRFGAAKGYLTVTRPWIIGAQDLDADGDVDLAVVSTWSDSVAVMQNNGMAGFVARTDRAVTSDPRAVAMGDLNGDGWPEIVAANYGGNTASALVNQGGSSFIAKQELEVGAAPTSIALSDLNGDHRPDVIVTNINDAAVGVLRNEGGTGLSFAPRQAFATGAGPYRVAVGDLDGDGKPDLAVSNYRDNSVTVLRNASQIGGEITFTNRTDIPVGIGPRAIEIADMDHDGKPDLVVGHRGESSYCVLRNVSTPSSGLEFAPRVSYPLEFPGERLAVGDLDRDGFVDLVIIDYYGTRLTSLINNGDGTFRPGPQAQTSDAPWLCAVVDVDHDTLPDVVVVNYFGNSVSVYLGARDASGSLQFLPKIDFGAGLNPYALAVGDLDRDGLLDVAVANSGANSISILRNQSGAIHRLP